MLYQMTCKKCGATLKDAGNNKAYCVRCGEIYPIQNSPFSTPVVDNPVSAIKIGFQFNGDVMGLDASKLREKRKMETDMIRISKAIESEARKILQACWDTKEGSAIWAFTGAKIVFDSVLTLLQQKGFNISFIVKPDAVQNAEAIVTGRVKIAW